MRDEFPPIATFDSVCGACVEDDDLVDYVATNGRDEACDFCGAEGVVAVMVSDLFDYMARCLAHEYEPASTSAEIPVSSDWDGHVPTLSSEELLYNYGDPLREGKLQELFCEIFDDEWVEVDYWAGSYDERLLFGWQAFCELIKDEARFVFLHRALRGRAFGAELDPTEMLDTIADIVTSCGLIVEVPLGLSVARGRKHRPEKSFSTVSELSAPRPDQATHQRMSPAGVSFFYGALDEETCLAELRGVEGEVATVAQWVTTRPLWVVDLHQIPPVPGIFDLVGDAHQRHHLMFLTQFREAITQPVRFHDRPAVDYVPTQAVAEYLRHCVKAPDGSRLDGILYPSVARDGGNNIALFEGVKVTAPPEPSRLETHAPFLVLQGTPRRHEAVKNSTEWRSDGDSIGSSTPT